MVIDILVTPIEINIILWSVLFVDNLSTNCAVFIDSLPAFRPAEVARLDLTLPRCA